MSPQPPSGLSVLSPDSPSIRNKTFLVGSCLFRVYRFLSLPLSSWGIHEQDKYYFLHFISEQTEAQLSHWPMLIQGYVTCVSMLCSSLSFPPTYLLYCPPFLLWVPAVWSMQTESQRFTNTLVLLQGPILVPSSLPKGSKSSLSLRRVARVRVSFVPSFEPKEQCGQRH